MINVKIRHLNQGFYKGLVSGQGYLEYRYETLGQFDDEAKVKSWVADLGKAFNGFHDIVPCEGSISLLVIEKGFATEGSLYIFDATARYIIQPAIEALYKEAQHGQNLCKNGSVISVICDLKMLSFYLSSEGLTMPFSELDTECIVESTKSDIVTVHSPLLNQ